MLKEISAIGLLPLFLISNVSNFSYENKIYEIFGVIKNRNNARFEKNENLNIKLNDKNFEVYDIYDSSKFLGDILFDDNKNIQSIYVGEEKLNKNVDLSLISPIFSNEEVFYQSEEGMNYYSHVGEVIDINEDLYETDSNSGASTQTIINCPSYYNYSYGPINNGCSPTAGTMLLSFFDRYSNLNNLINGLLPLEHSNNKTAVDNVIIELANDMHTNMYGFNGTLWNNIAGGLYSYIHRKGYTYLDTYRSMDYTDYSYLINTAHNPSILNISTVNDDGSIGYHSTLGIGTGTFRYSGQFMATHYDWISRPGTYYVSKNYFDSCVYIGY